MERICKFVSSTQFRRNPKLFIYDKERPSMASYLERAANPVLDCVDRPSGGCSAYKNFSIMSTEKNFVPGDAVRITVTPAQKALLDLISHPNAPDYSEFLKEVHELGTYYPEKDLVNLTASLHVHWLQEAIAAIAEEHFTNSKQA